MLGAQLLWSASKMVVSVDDAHVDRFVVLGDAGVAVTGLLQCRYPVQAAVQGAAEWMVHFTESR